MKCGVDGDTACMARQGDQCMEHLITDTPSCPSRVPLTNADRIRAMSDEELAAVLVLEPMGEKIPFCKNRPECDKLLDEDRDIPEEMCAKCMLDWLKQEVKK